MALEVGPAALTELEAAGFLVQRIVEDHLRYPFLPQSVPLVQGDQAWASGHDGTGTVIAILDTGVDSTHPFLAGRVVEEACYSSGGNCPNGQTTQLGPGAGMPCTFDPSSCVHGTHVAGIAAGNGSGAGVSFSGVAKGAQLMAVQVFSNVSGQAGAYDSDIIAGLSRVYALRATYNFAAVNLSLGGGRFSTTCDTALPQYQMPIDNLRSVGIATVIASGNDALTNQISAPACISSAVSVGSTTKTDGVSWFSNVAPFLSLFAPGGAADFIPGDDILSSVPSGGYAEFAGTSMAAPHAAGAWAILKQAAPTATVTEILTALQSTGLPITDARSGGRVTKPRIRIYQALLTLAPVITGATPSSAGPGATLDVTLTGSGFQPGTTVSFGAGITVNTTTFTSTSQLVANITVQAGASPGPRTITATRPDGRSGSLADGFTVPPPAPVITSLNPSSVNAFGPAFTLTVTGGNFVGNSVVQVNGSARPTTYGAATQLTAAIPASDLAGAGSLAITVMTPAPGGGTSNAATLTVVGPALAVSATTVAPGASVTVTLTNGLGGAYDWLALAPVGAGVTIYVQGTSVGAGVTTRTWTVTMPSTLGGYEFRLFLNGSYTRAATSPTVTVE